MIAPAVPLGPFLVLENGHLLLRMPDSEPCFTFLWRNRRFAVRICQDRMCFSVPVGRLPSTAADSGRRDRALGTLRALVRILPAGWRMTLLPDHRIQIACDQAMPLPTTASALMTPVVTHLLRAAPVLDLLEECGLA
jgi:hypothetical protein